MTLLINIGIFCLNVIYFFIKCLPTRRKIVFISRQKDNPSIDFKLLGEELRRQDDDIEVVMLCKVLGKTFKSRLLYIFHMFKQMYHLATSKIVVLDSYCISVSVLKHKKSLRIIQMWHAMGSYKKFAYSILDKKEGSSKKIAHLMRMHKNYDYVFASSKKASINFAEAFNIELNKVKIMPLPRVDLLLDKGNVNLTKENIYSKYPILKEKKNILYAPTFRKKYNSKKDIYNLIDSVDYDNYNLIIKLHPLSKIKIDDSRVIVDDSFTSLEMGFVSDYIISDYSAVVFELALLKKPLYFYAYDLDSYINNRDFYLNYKKEMPGLISKDPKKIINDIEHNIFDLTKLNKFSKDYVELPKEGCTNAIVKFILDKLN